MLPHIADEDTWTARRTKGVEDSQAGCTVNDMVDAWRDPFALQPLEVQRVCRKEAPCASHLPPLPVVQEGSSASCGEVEVEELAEAAQGRRWPPACACLASSIWVYRREGAS